MALTTQMQATVTYTTFRDGTTYTLVTTAISTEISIAPGTTYTTFRDGTTYTETQLRQYGGAKGFPERVEAQPNMP